MRILLSTVLIIVVCCGPATETPTESTTDASATAALVRLVFSVYLIGSSVASAVIAQGEKRVVRRYLKQVSPGNASDLKTLRNVDIGESPLSTPSAPGGRGIKINDFAAGVIQKEPRYPTEVVRSFDNDGNVVTQRRAYLSKTRLLFSKDTLIANRFLIEDPNGTRIGEIREYYVSNKGAKRAYYEVLDFRGFFIAKTDEFDLNDVRSVIIKPFPPVGTKILGYLEPRSTNLNRGREGWKISLTQDGAKVFDPRLLINWPSSRVPVRFRFSSQY